MSSFDFFFMKQQYICMLHLVYFSIFGYHCITLMRCVYLCRYLCGMRERYHSPGAEFELSTEQKIQLDLVEPASWNVDKLLTVQNQIVAPLILYW